MFHSLIDYSVIKKSIPAETVNASTDEDDDDYDDIDGGGVKKKRKDSKEVWQSISFYCQFSSKILIFVWSWFYIYIHLFFYFIKAEVECLYNQDFRSLHDDDDAEDSEGVLDLLSGSGNFVLIFGYITTWSTK